MQYDQNTTRSVFDRLDIYRALSSAKRMRLLELQTYALENIRKEAQQAENSSLQEAVVRWLKTFHEFETSITRDYQ